MDDKSICTATKLRLATPELDEIYISIDCTVIDHSIMIVSKEFRLL